MRTSFLTSLLPLLALAACVPASRPPASAPQPLPRIAAPVPAPLPPSLGPDWRDWPLTPGTWSYRRDARGSLATFGEGGTEALMTLRCDLYERRMYLSLAGAPAGTVTLRTTSTTRALSVQPTNGTTLAPTDPLLDALAFSRGRFTVERTGAAPLVVPAYAEVGRVTEDCRG